MSECAHLNYCPAEENSCHVTPEGACDECGRTARQTREETAERRHADALAGKADADKRWQQAITQRDHFRLELEQLQANQPNLDEPWAAARAYAALVDQLLERYGVEWLQALRWLLIEMPGSGFTFDLPDARRDLRELELEIWERSGEVPL